MRIALGQFNAVVGDLSGNIEKMKSMWAGAVEAGADLVIFPELAVCGYPPEDLVYKRQFLDDNRTAVETLAAACPAKTIVVGFVESVNGTAFNAAAVIQDGRIAETYQKRELPNYGVFDERRYFRPGNRPVLVELAGLNIVLTICEDLWEIEWLKRFYTESGPFDLLLNISASPFHMGKFDERGRIITRCSKAFNCAVAYCNLVGCQDELVFDGQSILADSSGHIVTRARAFEEDLLIADVTRAEENVTVASTQPNAAPPEGPLDEIYHALVLGTRDYARKNGFKKVLLGLSGGIDSAVTAAVAVAALGAENVLGITMPSRFNSPETIADAKKVADNLGIELLTIPIEPILTPFSKSLGADPRWDDKGIAYENLQSRIRGTILMSLSNQIGALVLTTGNKSETSVGYSTLYGDTAGGFAVIKDVLKTMVYRLATYMNAKAGRELIPSDVITRPPSAELRPDQKDADSLPDYDLLDEIIKGYVEKDLSARELVASGLPAKDVERVIRLIDQNEYKRRQSPPGVRITPKAFGKDRRLPITNRYTTTIPRP
ncbi:NAD+ synthase [Anaerobaca lacustris]|uniref:Glutamine-dependent NAD(+) synthetase n=1 Tax=Anaerobaca lacustris TaxID=3044600 RepID=A0AAW6TZJ8_9BACT|nr:NAD+ synthase [Sedimentisphaerales bacterium M17dextr]